MHVGEEESYDNPVLVYSNAETIGYAVTETPIVIVDVQRKPSAGKPPCLHSMIFIEYGSHGDYQIIALALHLSRSYDFTIKAFELSEKFRTGSNITDEIVEYMRRRLEYLRGI